MSRSLVIYILFMIALCGAILYAGPVDQAVFGHDLFCLMEGAWKILYGDIPYRDFSTFHGPIPHLLVAAGMILAGPTANAMPISVVLGLVPISILAWYVFRGWMNSWLTLFTCTYLALVWAAPFPLHFDYYYLSYGMIYNRQSYVILSILMGILLQDARKFPCLTGFSLALLLFFKIPYFVAGLFLCAYYILFKGWTLRQLGRIVWGFLIIALPMTFFLRGTDLGDMFLIFYQTGENRTGDEILKGENLVLGELHATAFLLAFVIFCLARFHWKNSGDTARLASLPKPIQLATEGEFVLLASVVADLGGFPDGSLFDMPLLAVYSIILLDRLIKHATYRSDLSENIFSLVCALCCLIVVLPLWTRSFYGVWQIVDERMSSRIMFSNNTNVAAPGFENIMFLGTCGTYPRDVSYTVKINDGLYLIKSHPELDACSIATLDFSDPFSLALRRPPPPHMPVCLTFGYNVSQTIQPDPREILAGCGALMIPQYPDTSEHTLTVLRPKYHDYIAANFTKIDESRLWILYKRK